MTSPGDRSGASCSPLQPPPRCSSPDPAPSVTDPPPARSFTEAPGPESIPVIVSSGAETVSEPVMASVIGAQPASDPGPLRVSFPSRPHGEGVRRSGGFPAVEVPTLETLFSPEPQLDVTLEHPGRYAAMGLIGAGRLGPVSLQRDLHLAREVALKEIDPRAVTGAANAESLSSDEARLLFQARTVGRLVHPGIVTIHELGRRADGTLYYTMGLVRGCSLRELVAERPLAERLELVPNFLALCQALAYAHSCGVVHRDLSPEHVMIGQSGETVVVGWDYARVRGEPDLHGGALKEKVDRVLGGAPPAGAAPYLSPEHVRGELEGITARSDVHTLGAILFLLLTGVAPFSGIGAAELKHAIVEQPPPDPLGLEPGCPPALAMIALRALAKRSGSRYADARALARDVTEFVAGAVGGAEYYRLGPRLRRAFDGHPANVALALLLALGVAIAIGLLLD